jgi:hypothetical protein
MQFFKDFMQVLSILQQNTQLWICHLPLYHVICAAFCMTQVVKDFLQALPIVQAVTAEPCSCAYVYA